MPRIVGGRAGGRRLTVPPGRLVRPTSERVREALASALEAGLGGLAGRTVLDAFAGSGAVGLELLSRGAAQVALVEADPGVRRVLTANVAAVGLPGAQVSAGRAETVLAAFAAESPPRAYDVVFVDPPYALEIDALLPVAAGLTSEVLVVERSMRSPQPTLPDGFEPAETRRYGDTMLWYGWRS